MTFDGAARLCAEQCGFYGSTGRVPVVVRLEMSDGDVAYNIRWVRREQWWTTAVDAGVEIVPVVMFERIAGVDYAVTFPHPAGRLVELGICERAAAAEQLTPDEAAAPGTVALLERLRIAPGVAVP